MKKKIDWLVTYTVNGEFCACCGKKEYDYLPNFFNAKTDGLKKYGHKEFQMVLRIDNKMVLYILNSLGLQVKAGKVFKDGDRVSNILEGFDIRLMECVDDHETYLRVLLPDPRGLFPDDSNCQCIYAMQQEPIDCLKIGGDDSPILRLYQMIHSPENIGIMWEEYDVVVKETNRIPSEKYRCVFDGRLGIKFPEEAFETFNLNLPQGYKGRSMSVSDVIEFEYSNGQMVFYYCNPCGFVMCRFDKEKISKGERF